MLTHSRAQGVQLAVADINNKDEISKAFAVRTFYCWYCAVVMS